MTAFVKRVLRLAAWSFVGGLLGWALGFSTAHVYALAVPQKPVWVAHPCMTVACVTETLNTLYPDRTVDAKVVFARRECEQNCTESEYFRYVVWYRQ